VQTAGILIGTLTKLPARVQVGKNQFEGWDFEFRMNVDRNTAAIVTEGTGTVDVQSDVDTVAVARQMLVDRVVENLKNAMVQPALVGWPNVHPGPLPDAG
jgi:hypothetical protein